MNEQNVVSNFESKKSVRDLAKIEARIILFQFGFFKKDGKEKVDFLNDSRGIYNAIFAPFKKSEMETDLYFSIKTLKYMIQIMRQTHHETNLLLSMKEESADETRKYRFQGCIK